MSKSRHPRRAALLAVSLAVGAPLGAPLLAAAPAGAEVVESGRQVIFSGGGLLSVSCAAYPNAGSVTIAAETSLRVVNRTGHRATLLLDGSPRGEVPEGSTAEVLFHRGPVALSLKPHCVLADENPVRVQVIKTRTTGKEPPPARPGSTPRAPQGSSSPDGRGTDGPVGANGAGKAVLGRAPGDDAGKSDAEPNQAEPRDVPKNVVPKGVTPVRPREPDTGSGRGGDPAPRPDGDTGDDDPLIPDGAALPSGDPTEVADGAGTADSVGAADVADDLDAPSAASFTDGAAGGDGQGLAAEPLASVEPLSNKGPTGLLALIAIICVLGALAGAIRAILAQRASRAGIA